MRRDDPLDEVEWTLLEGLLGETLITPERIAKLRADVRKTLDRVTDLLDNPPPRLDWWSIPRWGLGGGLGVAAEDVPRTQALYRRMAEARGAGILDIQEMLLKLINQAEEPVSIPFWVEMLDYVRPRDHFGARRRTYALAGLARLAIQRDDGAALAALRAAMHHSRAEIRALAVHYLGRVVLNVEEDDQDFVEDEGQGDGSDNGLAFFEDEGQEEEPEEALPPRPVAPEILAELTDIAVRDPAFGPRFQARSVLRDAGQPVPLDNPEGVFAFKVSLRGARVSRTIELRSTQTLANLHFAIQHAFGWDSDHLYSFYMTGEEDDLYTFTSPYEDAGGPWADEAIIGELGLTKGHSFAYLFDYGDHHEFTIKVAGLRPQAGSGEYPQVVGEQGEAPEQYQYSE